MQVWEAETATDILVLREVLKLAEADPDVAADVLCALYEQRDRCSVLDDILSLAQEMPLPPIVVELPPPPVRVQVQGDLFHGRVPEGAVYVGRAAPGLKRSRYANPFTVAEHGANAVNLYWDYLKSEPELLAAARAELAGRDLACWCPDWKPCHAQVLIAAVHDPAWPHERRVSA
jgi:hypothetical protein